MDDEYTTVSLDAVAFSRDTRGDRTVLYLADGVIMIELLPDVPRPNKTRIDSAEQTIYLDGPGVYRIEVLSSGGLWVEVWDGQAEAATPSGAVPLRAGTAAEVGGAEISAVQAQLTDRDDFARWVQARRSQQYVVFCRLVGVLLASAKRANPTSGISPPGRRMIHLPGPLQNPMRLPRKTGNLSPWISGASGWSTVNCGSSAPPRRMAPSWPRWMPSVSGPPSGKTPGVDGSSWGPRTAD